MTIKLTPKERRQKSLTRKPKILAREIEMCW